MVRLKSRHIVCEIIYADDDKPHSVEEYHLYLAIRDILREIHGEFAIAATAQLPSLRVKYLNPDTRIVFIRVSRDMCKLLQSAIVYIKKIGDEDAFLRTLHLGGTIRSCNKFLIRHHKTQLPLLLQACRTDEERRRVQAAIIASNRECKQKLAIMEQT